MGGAEDTCGGGMAGDACGECRGAWSFARSSVLAAGCRKGSCCASGEMASGEIGRVPAGAVASARLRCGLPSNARVAVTVSRSTKPGARVRGLGCCADSGAGEPPASLGARMGGGRAAGEEAAAARRRDRTSTTPIERARDTAIATPTPRATASIGQGSPGVAESGRGDDEGDKARGLGSRSGWNSKKDVPKTSSTRAEAAAKDEKAASNAPDAAAPKMLETITSASACMAATTLSPRPPSSTMSKRGGMAMTIRICSAELFEAASVPRTRATPRGGVHVAHLLAAPDDGTAVAAPTGTHSVDSDARVTVRYSTSFTSSIDELASCAKPHRKDPPRETPLTTVSSAS